MIFLAVFLIWATAVPSPDQWEQEWQLRESGSAALAARNHRKCKDSFLQLARMESSRPITDALNAAICSAMLGETPGAIEHLQLALSRGFREPDRLEQEDAFRSLRSDLRWNTLTAWAVANKAAYLKQINQELYEIYQKDQAARRGPPSPDLKQEDAQRLRRVQEILKRGGARHSEDYLHAAFIFQHGDDVNSARRAHQLALQSVKLDETNGMAKWIAAAAKDRELVRRKLPQKYGTQFNCANKVCKLEPWDPSTTDSERARWNVPPLKISQMRAENMTRGMSAPPPAPPPPPTPASAPIADSPTRALSPR
jgi:hypothetical protein